MLNISNAWVDNLWKINEILNFCLYLIKLGNLIIYKKYEPVYIKFFKKAHISPSLALNWNENTNLRERYFIQPFILKTDSSYVKKQN